MKRKIANYLKSKEKKDYNNLEKIFDLYLNGDIKKLLSNYSGVDIYPTINKLGKTIQLNYNYQNEFTLEKLIEEIDIKIKNHSKLELKNTASLEKKKKIYSFISMINLYLPLVIGSSIGLYCVVTKKIVKGNI